MKNGETQAEFATALGVPNASLGNYLRGSREPSTSFLIRLKEKRGADINWLLTGQPAAESSGRRQLGEVLSDQVPLPRYDIQASAGPGAIALREDVSDFMIVSRAWLARFVSPNAQIGVIEARGDSMEPTIIDGDVLMVTHDIDGDDVAGGGIFVLSIDGNLMVKRLQKTIAGDVRVISDNPAYESETIFAAELVDRLIVHAKVFWHGGPLRRRTT